MKTKELKYEDLAKLFTVDVDGVVRWNVNKATRVKVGDICGSMANNGYLGVTLDYKRYSIHRIAYILHNKVEIPEGMQIDHIDRNRINNRKDNLRLVDTRLNANNKVTNTQHINLKLTPSGKYMIRFWIAGENRYFGTYPLEEALVRRDAIIADFENVCKKYEELE